MTASPGVRAGAGPVFDDEGLSQPFREPLSNQAGGNVVSRGGRESDDPGTGREG